MPGVTLHGDLASIKFGRYCCVHEGTVIRPGARMEPDISAAAGADSEVQLRCLYTPMLVGNHTHIGRGCTVEAAAIGCNVVIGDNCILVSALALSTALQIRSVLVRYVYAAGARGRWVCSRGGRTESLRLL